MRESENKRAKMGNNMGIVYADVGDKRNYAGCAPQEDGSLIFMGWIMKYCAKDADTIIKTTMEDIKAGKPGLI